MIPVCRPADMSSTDMPYLTRTSRNQKGKKHYLCIMKTITEKYKDRISFELSCYDRLIFTGGLPDISYAGGMTSYLNGKGDKNI
jgi:hypothetical protein